MRCSQLYICLLLLLYVRLGASRHTTSYALSQFRTHGPIEVPKGESVVKYIMEQQYGLGSCMHFKALGRHTDDAIDGLIDKVLKPRGLSVKHADVEVMKKAGCSDAMPTITLERDDGATLKAIYQSNYLDTSAVHTSARIMREGRVTDCRLNEVNVMLFVIENPVDMLPGLLFFYGYDQCVNVDQLPECEGEMALRNDKCDYVREAYWTGATDFATVDPMHVPRWSGVHLEGYAEGYGDMQFVGGGVFYEKDGKWVNQ